MNEAIVELEKRREQALMTLDYLKREQAEIEANTQWRDQAAYENRVSLLGRLTDWYNTEIEEIDNVLQEK